MKITISSISDSVITVVTEGEKGLFGKTTKRMFIAEIVPLDDREALKGKTIELASYEIRESFDQQGNKFEWLENCVEA
jgi:hypothetical protein